MNILILATVPSETTPAQRVNWLRILAFHSCACNAALRTDVHREIRIIDFRNHRWRRGHWYLDNSSHKYKLIIKVLNTSVHIGLHVIYVDRLFFKTHVGMILHVGWCYLSSHSMWCFDCLLIWALLFLARITGQIQFVWMQPTKNRQRLFPEILVARCWWRVKDATWSSALSTEKLNYGGQEEKSIRFYGLQRSIIAIPWSSS